MAEKVTPKISFPDAIDVEGIGGAKPNATSASSGSLDSCEFVGYKSCEAESGGYEKGVEFAKSAEKAESGGFEKGVEIAESVEKTAEDGHGNGGVSSNGKRIEMIDGIIRMGIVNGSVAPYQCVDGNSVAKRDPIFLDQCSFIQTSGSSSCGRLVVWHNTRKDVAAKCLFKLEPMNVGSYIRLCDDIDEEKNSIEKPIVTSALDPDVSNGVRPIKIQTEKKRTALAIDGDDNDVEKRDTSSEMGTPIHNTTKKKKIMKMGDDNMTEALSNKCLFLRGLHSYFTLSCITSITQIIKALSSSNPALGISSPKSRHRPLSLSSVMGVTLLGDGVVDKHAMVATRVSSKWDSALWFHANFPHLHLEDKVLLIGGGVDTGLASSSPGSRNTDPAHASSSPSPPSKPDEETQSDLMRSRPIRKRYKPTK